MTSSNWTVLGGMLETALALPPHERSAYLDRACLGQPGLRAQADRLLLQHEEEERLRPAGRQRPDTSGIPSGFAHPYFELLEPLGTGGSGVVYRARDRRRGTQVALKVLWPGDADLLNGFKREFRQASAITHPNIVQLHELFSDGTQWFFTMELVEGKTTIVDYVWGPLPRSGPLPATGWARLRAGFSQLAAGIAALHASGVVHGDIKPQNVLVAPGGRVVVLDFGLVRPFSDERSAVVGTVAYMAPEQIQQAPVAPPTDWYAFGAVLFEAITGTRAFEGSLFEIYRQKLERDVTLPRVPGVPGAVAALCDRLLQRAPDARPDLDAILQCLSSDEAYEAPPPVQRPVFIGRRSHLEALETAQRRVDRGLPTCIHVHGPSGIGKTSLLRTFVEGRAGQDDTIVLTGRCYEAESVPFKALDEVVDGLSRELTRWTPSDLAPLIPRDLPLLLRVFPALQRAFAPTRTPSAPQASETALRDRAIAALVELVSRLAERRRLIIWIDDVQWGDLDSARILNDLQRPPDAPCLLLILSYRREAMGSPVLLALDEGRQNDAPPQARRDLPVDAMDPNEGLSLASALCGTLAADDLTALVQESGGSPLLLQELAQIGGRHEREDGHVSLTALVSQRIDALLPETRRLLELVAVAGQPIDARVAREAAGVERPRAEWALVTARLVRTSQADGEHRLDTYHDKVREAVLAGLSPDALRERHARLARAFEAAGRVDPERLVRHYVAAGIDDAAFSAALAAADAAEQSLAFERAATLYRLALELRPRVTTSGLEVIALRRNLARTLANAGRSAEAAEMYQAAAGEASLSPDERLDLGALAADQLLRAGRIDDGLGLLTANLRQRGMRIPRHRGLLIAALAATRLRLRASRLSFRRQDARQAPPVVLERVDRLWTAATTLATIDPILSSYLRGQHLRFALRSGEPSRVSMGLALEAVQRVLPGAAGYPQARTLLDRARELAVQSGQRQAEAMVLSAEAGVAYYAGRPREALRFGLQGEAMLLERGTSVAWELATIRMWILGALSLMGHWKEYWQRLQAILAEATRNGDRYSQSAMHLAAGSFVAYLANDDPNGARQQMDQQLARWGRDVFDVPRAGHAVGTAETFIYEGRYAEAWAVVETMWPQLKRTMMLRVEFLRNVADGLRARAALGLHSTTGDPRLLVEAERVAAHRRGALSSNASGVGLMLEGCIALARGERDRAIARLQLGEERLRDGGSVQFAAASRRRRGELIGGAYGDDLIREADAELMTLGATNPARTAARILPGAFRSAAR